MRGRNYRSSAGQPYTRLKYIRGPPVSKISKFNMGDLAINFPFQIHLVARESVQIRHNALESARVAANKVLFDKYGETGFKIQLRPYPHIVLRENKMIATAGADRLQEGMRRSFGKPTGRAARVNDGQSIMTIHVNRDGVEAGKKACRTASSKLPLRTSITVEETPSETPQLETVEPETVEPETVEPVHELTVEPASA